MDLQYALELIGTFFFAISGALALQGKEADWFAAAFTGFLTAIGGGTLRDVLLGSYPLVWIGDINFRLCFPAETNLHAVRHCGHSLLYNFGS